MPLLHFRFESAQEKAFLESWEGGTVIFREEIARWLAANDYPSVYTFARPEQHTTPQPEAKQLRTRERNTLLRIIGALLEVAQDRGAGKAPRSQESVIADLLEKYPGKEGIKDTTLQQKFAEANRILKAD